MYWPNIIDLKRFYASTLGAAVCRRIQHKIKRIWPDIFDDSRKEKTVIVGMGYALPYLTRMLNKMPLFPVALMASGNGAVHWPEKGKNQSLLSGETLLPFDDDSVERVILSHLLEYSNHPQHLLNEIFRILSPQGKILVIVPNRMSIWSRVESTPFGHGHPYSIVQLQELLRQSLFETKRVEMALLFPPTRSRFFLRIAEILYKISQRVCRFPIFTRMWGGAIIIEAQKQVYAANVDNVFDDRRKRMIYRPIPANFGNPRER